MSEEFGSVQGKALCARPSPGVGDRPLLSLAGVSKSFPGVRALHDVSLSLYPGQVTALIGENGAGKSTLVKILTGIHQPDRGVLAIDGRAVSLPSAHAALERGITAIHQETVLFEELSVAENIFLGHAPRRFGIIDWRRMRRQAREALDILGARHLKPDMRLKDLNIANRHLVAVARAMAVDARIVIMDEPTAALSQNEIDELFLLIQFLKETGRAVLFISHKFEEIFRVADRYSVFRDGEMVGEGLIRTASQDEIVRMMVGRSIDNIYPAREASIGRPVLTVEDLCHPTEFEGISFELHEGEILGFYGLVGAGRSELMHAIFGMTRASRGAMTLDGAPFVPKSAAAAVGAGVVYVPEERGRQGAILAMPIVKNMSLPSLARVTSAGVLRVAEEFRLAGHFAERLGLRAASLSQAVGTLSGGNQQKVVIGKWLATNPKVIILDEPTKGIDIGSKAAVHGFMAELVAQGLCVIMVSSELPEILGMSDRVAVMREGRIVALRDRREVDAVALVELATGRVRQ